MKNWKERLSRTLARVEPATRAAERVAQLAVHMSNGVTLPGAIGMAAAGTNALREWLSTDQRSGVGLVMPIPTSDVVSAFKRSGAVVTSTHSSNGRISRVSFSLGGESFDMFGNVVYVGNDAMEEWARQAIEPEMPHVFSLRNTPRGPELRPIRLSPFDTDQGAEIARTTAPLVSSDESRCILLEGKPGVGKTCMAQEVARRLGIGRVAVVDSAVVGSPRSERNHASTPRPVNENETVGVASLGILSAAVIIVDDIDKVWCDLSSIEWLRKSARLVILTANNGAHDEVLDAAMIRPGRVDEVFTIKPHHRERAEPFDRLDDATWERIREWPVACLNEVAKRVRTRGVAADALRLDEIEQRLERRTRSGDVLL